MKIKRVFGLVSAAALFSALAANQTVDTLTDRNLLSEFIRGDGLPHCPEEATRVTDCRWHQGIIGSYLPGTVPEFVHFSATFGRERLANRLLNDGHIIDDSAALDRELLEEGPAIISW